MVLGFTSIPMRNSKFVSVRGERRGRGSFSPP